MTGPVILQWAAAETLCIGVENAVENELVVSMLVNSQNTRWLLDASSGVISLESKPDLVLTVQAITPQNMTPLCLMTRQVSDANQKWDWSKLPVISLVNSSGNFCIDNQNGVSASGTVIKGAGNQIQVYQQIDGDLNQQWNIVNVTI